MKITAIAALVLASSAITLESVDKSKDADKAEIEKMAHELGKKIMEAEKKDGVEDVDLAQLNTEEQADAEWWHHAHHMYRLYRHGRRHHWW